MKNIVVSKGNYTPPGKLDVEVVERKGLGHPDTLIDGIMESISRELSKIYLQEFGAIMHHNVDKGIIVGGATDVEFGSGHMKNPIYVLLVGRATDEFNGKRIDVNSIAIETAKKYVKTNMRYLDPEQHMRIESMIRPGSKDLIDVFLRKGIPKANDTSFGVGYAPYTDAERVALYIEQFLNSVEYKKKNPYIGEDIKVMVSRENELIKVTVALAFVSLFVSSSSEYYEIKKKVKEDIEKEVKRVTDLEVKVFLNTADKDDSVYITLTGTSAEAGDDGSVGRGNRANGLITPYRLMTLEACAGKNPVNHVGKLYSVLSFKIAEKIYREIKGDVEDISLTILSQIGKPINDPKVCFIELVKPGSNEYLKTAQNIAEQELDNIEKLTMEIIEGKYPVYY